MGQFGELFGGVKLRKESEEDQGTGERFEAGPLDLDAGVVPVRSASKPPADQEQAE